MNQSSSKKTSHFITFAVFFFSFVRSVVFATKELIGFNLDEKELIFTSSSALFWILLLLYSALSAALVFSVSKKWSNIFWLPCILLISDPIFIINQTHLSVLLIEVLWIFYLNIQNSSKNVLKNILKILLIFIAATISPETALGLFPIMVLSEFIPNITKNKKGFFSLPLCLSVFSMVAGILLNKETSIPQIESIINLLNVSYYSEINKIFAVLLLAIPSILIGVAFIKIFISTYKEDIKHQKKSFKKTNPTKYLLNVISLAAALLLIGSIFGGYKTLCMLYMFVPTIILMFIFSDNKTAESTLIKIDTIILKFPVAFTTIFMLTYYLCLKFYLAEFGGYVVADFFIINK